ncbi:DeoR/GlpR family DNA-binding transcription regulator [Sinorhizobium sp. BG8]|uniref:DeoR/GlpR family DNA-binding transcription regulator n=1 Tax=Sinorhizobium sp. BG8 TaxID=2613773 RepID=UPI00193EBBA0|nr:DeoR/GlpR family DNA-binding transcription regulator [Sinorhizobium sp. BG8]QRM56413.1 DeoR/GlpR transcriptional regulator [Sinorhizobium sp. BG8]
MSEEKMDAASLAPEERQAIILQRVNSTGRVIATALAAEFGVSEDSIRRDLRDLSDAGLVQRFHGGASRLVTPALEYQRREALGNEEKQLIGRAAAATIPAGSTLLVDSSTTIVHFIRSLPATLPVRVVTTAIDVAAAALEHPLAEVILLGGRLNKLTRSSTGAATVEAIRALRADFCVLGTCGIDDDLVVRADDYDDAFMKAAMMKASNKTLLLASSEKLGRAATHEVAPLSAVSSLFTDAHDNPILKRIEELGLDVEKV